MFMDQISIYESNELTAFGFFNFNLKLIMSVSKISTIWNHFYMNLKWWNSKIYKYNVKIVQ